jgi:mercuric ion transport protein
VSEEAKLSNRNLLRTGIAGTVITAICCVTPVLVVLFGALGVSAWLGWIDFLLFPLLAAFIALTVFALSRRRAGEPSADTGDR